MVDNRTGNGMTIRNMEPGQRFKLYGDIIWQVISHHGNATLIECMDTKNPKTARIGARTIVSGYTTAIPVQATTGPGQNQQP